MSWCYSRPSKQNKVLLVNKQTMHVILISLGYSGLRSWNKIGTKCWTCSHWRWKKHDSTIPMSFTRIVSPLVWRSWVHLRALKFGLNWPKYTPIFQRPYRYKDMEIFDLIINLRVVGNWPSRFFCMRVCFNYHDASEKWCVWQLDWKINVWELLTCEPSNQVQQICHTNTIGNF
jgi:hypothetical protein